jgi:hypothetical protein
MDSTTKTKGVMTALKGRSGFGSKKGVALLGIVQKLSEKRRAMAGQAKPMVMPKPPIK